MLPEATGAWRCGATTRPGSAAQAHDEGAAAAAISAQVKQRRGRNLKVGKKLKKEIRVSGRRTRARSIHCFHALSVKTHVEEGESEEEEGRAQSVSQFQRRPDSQAFLAGTGALRRNCRAHRAGCALGLRNRLCVCVCAPSSIVNEERLLL